MSATTALTIRRVTSADAGLLAAFFEVLGADADTVRFFRPHPLTAAYARELCGRVDQSRDRYYVGVYRGRFMTYSLLRGWEEGYAVPSLGIATHPGVRGAGLGHFVMAHGIAESRAAGAPRLRFTVYKANARGLHIWTKYGFTFSDKNEHEWLALLDLSVAAPLPGRRLDTALMDDWLLHAAAA